MKTRSKWICAGALVAGFLGCRATGGEPKDGVVVTCGAQLGLGVESGVRTDWSGETHAWSAEVTGDTLRLVRKGRCGDECNFTEEIVLAGISDECPRLVRASTSRRDAGSPVRGAGKIVEARRGSLEIQDWNPLDGVVSGRLTTEFKTTFYLNLAKDVE
jgi:hypothetical protein